MNEQKRMKLIDEAINKLGMGGVASTNIGFSCYRDNEGDIYYYLKCDEGVQTRLLCTNEEYLARIAERQNKPSWDDAPDWANWIAQDCDGEWSFFYDKPFVKFDVAFTNSVCSRSKLASKGEVIGRWQDTLEARPVERVGFVDGDWIDSAGLTIGQLKAVVTVAGKVFDERHHPVDDAVVFYSKYEYLQYESKESKSGAQHTLSEWLFKTAPDGYDELYKHKKGFYFYSGKDLDPVTIGGDKVEPFGRMDVGLIATRDAEAVQSEPFTPEVGGTYLLGNKQGYDLSYGHDIIGENVQLKAIWKTGNGYDVGAVEHESVGYVFMLDMLEPQKSEREEFNDGCVTVHKKLINEWDKDTTIYEAIYDAMKSGELPAPNLQPKIIREEFIEKAMEISNRMIDADMSDNVLVYGALYDELVNPV